jgi:signal transduction histidine kinase
MRGSEGKEEGGRASNRAPMPDRVKPAGIWTNRQRAALLLSWVLVVCLAIWRVWRGPWPDDLYRLAAVAAVYLLIRTDIVLRGEVPRRVEYAFLFVDAVLITVAIRILGGIDNDFYLAYFLVLGEGVLTLDLGLVGALCALVTLGYVAATWPAITSDQARPTVVVRLFFVLLICLGVAWAASREAARGREVAFLREQLLLEEERRRVAREIHDGVGHILAAGTQTVELAERLLPVDAQRAAALLPDLKKLLRQGLDEIRLLVLGLRPSGPSAGDAVAAARQHLAALWARTQISTEVHSEPSDIPLSPASEFAFRRIFQEALTNVVRHARARRVTVTLSRSDSAVTCSVSDDGVGMPSGSDRPRPGFGLQHMRERAEELGGTLDVSSPPGGGTMITFTLPSQARARPPGPVP